jgi:bacterioferritin
MATKGQELVKVNLAELIEKLNKAFADEWLAYYQYWVGAKVIRGKFSKDVVKELEQHAQDELRHADMLINRIIQLEGKPILKPEDWYKMTNCGYDAPEDTATIAILKQNIKGERCAIAIYNRLLELTKDKDIITYNMVAEILTDEVEHENDLQTLLEDIEG